MGPTLPESYVPQSPGSLSVCPARIFCVQALVSVGRCLCLCVLLTLVRAPGEAALRKEV